MFLCFDFYFLEMNLSLLTWYYCHSEKETLSESFELNMVIFPHDAESLKDYFFLVKNFSSWLLPTIGYWQDNCMTGSV